MIVFTRPVYFAYKKHIYAFSAESKLNNTAMTKY